MDPRLEELKKQRALIAQHLNWLDQEIQIRESSPSVVHEVSAEAVNSPVPRSPAVPPTDGSNRAELEQVEVSLPHPSHGITERQRLGCIVIAIALGAGSILVFWVLPHLLYD